MFKNNLEKFQDLIQRQFQKTELLEEALTHRSYLNENPNWPRPHNERLEFLGDAVLELVATEYLYRRFPEEREGRLTSFRAALVNYVILARIARVINLNDYLFLSRGEAKDGGKARDVILANALEALIGAVYLDGGYAEVQKFINKFILVNLEEVIKTGAYQDPKSLLQELAQDRFRVTPTYKVLKEAGPDHSKKFHVGVFLGEEKTAEGEGFSKQEAELAAAESALRKNNLDRRL